MNTVVPISQSDERLEDASRWVLKLDEGLSPAEQQSLDTWLAEHPRNSVALLEVAKAWDKLDSLERLADLFPHSQSSQQTKPALWQRRPVWVAAAASLLLLVSTAYLLLPHLEGLGGNRPLVTALQSAAYETEVGEQKTVLLPDGTEVVLNTNSQLSLVFTSSARVLTLARGEIHVKVAKDASRPLSVVAGDRIVQAVGTEFTVEITDEQHVEVMVTEGKVVVGIRPISVAQDGATNANPEPAANGVVVPPVLAQLADNTISAGEEIILGEEEATRIPVSLDEIEVKLSWKEGRLIFRSEPLEQALAEVERYTTVEFVILDEGLKAHTVSGRFRAGDVDALLALLEVNFNIMHETDSSGRVLLSSL